MKKNIEIIKKKVYINNRPPKESEGYNESVWFDYEKNQYYIKIKNKWQLQQLDIKSIDCGEYE